MRSASPTSALAGVINKLPTFRGISAVLYVAAHWRDIHHDLEQYRRQIKDREEWAVRMLEQTDRLHALEMQMASAEYERTAERAADLLMLLSVMLLHEEPAERNALLDSLPVATRNVIERAITEIVVPALRELKPNP